MMNTEKMKFSKRLNEVLDEVGFPQAGHGRQTALGNLLDVRPELVGQWLKGESYPKTSKLVKLAQTVGIRSNWLLSGIGQKYSSEKDQFEFRKQLEQRYPEKFKCTNQYKSDEKFDLTGTNLTPDAIEIACAYMKLPETQKSSLKNFLVEMESEH